jgi:hypothetical protein
MNTPATTCAHAAAVTKKYVGSSETYRYCPACMTTFGGEETPAKKKLIADAAAAGVTEQDEVDGRACPECGYAEQSGKSHYVSCTRGPE